MNQLAVARRQSPAKFEAEQVDGDRRARVRGGGQHGGGAERGGEVTGERVGAAEMAGEHRDGKSAGLIDDDDRRVGLLALQVRRDEADDGAERDDGDDAVEAGEERRHLVADLARVAVGGAGRRGRRLGAELVGGEEPGAGQRGDNPAGERDAMAGDGNDGNPHCSLPRGARFNCRRPLRPPPADCGSRAAVRRAAFSGSAPAAATGSSPCCRAGWRGRARRARPANRPSR
ncbi:MAG: hypothetical protein AW07_03358 [Candidatus Accumulibacter sp. SK-11]|nr:MAG: hypothetical protein AW07_03358 [Candidatus Accumulibacter sp. SK-11]